ncbi:MAG: 50S ribosomal protein L29 [Candidatus Binatia bacterium]|jgi:large subunit ribosomal protein L29
MRTKDVRDLSDQELEVRERELRESVFRFRLRRGTKQLESPAALLHARRDIARILTIQGERARAAKRG